MKGDFSIHCITWVGSNWLFVSDTSWNFN